MDIDPSLPDRHVGSMLSGEEVERLRQAIGWLRENRGLRLKDLALGCDSAEHTIRNFAYRKSNRPDNSFLGKLYKYLAGNKELLPAGHLTADAHVADAPDGSLRAFSRFDLIKMELPIAEGDLKRMFDRYSGYYLFYRRSYRPGRMSVSWLHLLPLSPKLKLSKGSLPLPRFTLFTKYPDRIDPDATQMYIVPGYATARNGRLYFVGHQNGELKFFTLTEPPSARFTYILPAGHLTADAHVADAPDGSLRAFSRFDLIKMELPIAEGDLKRMFDRYSGYYLFYRRSYRPGRMSVSWLHLLPLSPKLKLSKGSLPLPRFTLFTKYPDRIDPDATQMYIVPGYATARNGRLYFVGHQNGELKFFTLTEPPSARFTYMQGICLFSSADDNQPFSTRLVCQRLGPDVDRDDWEDKIGIFPVEQFNKAFDNADIVTRALGDGGVLYESEPD